MNHEHYAKEAKRLLADETLRSAFSTVYQSALEELVSVKADDVTSVLRLQAKAQVVEEVLAELSAAVARMAPQTVQTVP